MRYSDISNKGAHNYFVSSMIMLDIYVNVVVPAV